MSLRFQKRIQIAPGVRVNIGKRGVSLSAGPRGASMTLGRRGLHGNAGVPGTGLSYRNRLAGGNRGANSSGAVSEPNTLQVDVTEDGELAVKTAEGTDLTDSQMRSLKQQSGDELRGFLETQAELRNALVDRMGILHHDIPEPRREPVFESDAFDELPPSASRARRFLALFIPPIKQSLTDERERWQDRKSLFELREDARELEETDQVFREVSAMESVLSRYLNAIPWPQAPEVDFDFGNNYHTLSIDLKLPDDAGFPGQYWSLPARQYRIKSKRITDTERRRRYRDYVHSVQLRVVGEIYARLPSVNQVTISAYRDIVDPSNGHTVNEYIISAKIYRSNWEKINFSAWTEMDPVAVFSDHDLQRDMSKTGVFKAVSPF